MSTYIVMLCKSDPTTVFFKGAKQGHIVLDRDSLLRFHALPTVLEAGIQKCYSRLLEIPFWLFLLHALIQTCLHKHTD